MPEMMVWPDSSSVLHTERRIFLGQLAQRDAHLFLVALVFGSTATEITGSGNSMRSSVMIGRFDRTGCHRW